MVDSIAVEVEDKVEVKLVDALVEVTEDADTVVVA